ncbi:MAG: hypothetical protein NWF00_11300 [Candidatus Bathyarchaeota archaeon]|nr:hypothetical protein [Candidatus Bathyarchaeota archaeon]
MSEEPSLEDDTQKSSLSQGRSFQRSPVQNKCKVCGLTFSSHEELELHLKAAHNIEQ